MAITMLMEQVEVHSKSNIDNLSLYGA